MRKFFQAFIILSICLLVTTGCNEDKKTEVVDPVISTFYLIRHAEKDRTDPENKDPELNQDGLDRAIKWAEVFDLIELDAIYSTRYERTSMTAAPTSVKKEIEIEYYDPSSVDMETFKQSNAGKNVLVVGHSNTTPTFVNQLLGKKLYPQMEDTDNSSLFIVRFIDDEPTSIRLKID
ncbi:SixA phosphatase family protein [Flagellimonas allohymeniacidonis]|uniref:Histidine phosphatase family protein n=1 Tax=Flagellimonas allohymeniacidonis TaxID=2517819 RepID=A0A4Q8QLB4_9FLAO|nr:phosphoglycerate mutase family protein [Allomuricauda hymeniacidonis]TAI49046.1 histidine phosphatase family protein [Allomuricauda hymeniacidonis]